MCLWRRIARAARVAAARAGEMACRIGDFARGCCTARAATPSRQARPASASPLSAVEEFDAVGAASRVDGRQAALRAVGARSCGSIPPRTPRHRAAKPRAAASAPHRARGSGRSTEQGIACRRILHLQWCGREPLVQPGAGDRHFEQIALVVGVELSPRSAGWRWRARIATPMSNRWFTPARASMPAPAIPSCARPSHYPARTGGGC